MDKRRHRRVKARGVAGHLRSDTRAAACAVENLSLGGMFVRTAVQMPVGVAVLIDLVRPGLDKGLQVSGRVVSVVPAKDVSERGLAPGIGIAFDRMPEDVERRLRELIQQLDVEPDRPAVVADPRVVPAATAAHTTLARPIVEVDRRGGAVAAPVDAIERGPFAIDSTPAATQRGPAEGLVVNVKGLFEELSRAQAELQAREEEIASLKAEIKRLRADRRRP